MDKICCIFIAILLLASCSKKGGNSADNELPVVQLSSPANNQSFTAGQTVSVAGTVTDNKGIAELHVHISNNATAQLLIDIHRYPGTSNYVLNESFQVQAGITYKIQVIAVDKSGNQQIVAVLITSL